MSANLISQTLLNQYRVDAYVASGGMGVVYRVWDLKRNVPLAMKVLHADLAEDPSVYKRFKREANALKKLTHPNIVPFYGVEESRGTAFLLERFVDGPTLKDLLKQRQGTPIPVNEALTYLKVLSAALGYAHANGVVHCDVKPDNVMVDQGGHIYLTDFGIARHVESTTTTLGTAGTPAYMAPEQIRGDAVTPATDVYALGIMLYEMLTGQRPFRGDEKESESSGATAAERIRYGHVALPPPDPRLINPDMPEELASVILIALSKDMDSRFPSINKLFLAACAAVDVEPEAIPDRIIIPETIGSGYAGDAGGEISRGRRGVKFPTFQQIFSNHQRMVWIFAGIGILTLLLTSFFFGSKYSGSAPMPTASPSPSVRATTQQTSTRVVIEKMNTQVPTRTKTPSPIPTRTPIPTPTSTPLMLVINPSDAAEAVYIPAGEFLMGSNPKTDPYFYGAEGPEHLIYLDGYWIYRTEVTNGMYQKCVDQKSCPLPTCMNSSTRADYYNNPKFVDYPVVCVTWRMALAYCQWAGGSLPTEAEWEKAGRGTDGRLFSWGNQAPTSDLANWGNRDTTAVGSFPAGASPYGVYDMSGNVIEWVFDYFQPLYYDSSPYENPRGPASGETRVYRSGSFQNEDRALRVVMRGSRRETHSNIDIGFRCALDEESLSFKTP
jgi:serine/threonine protein kinase